MRIQVGLALGISALVAITSAAHAQTTNTFPASGNVGIGTTSPAYPLDVVGSGRFTGQLTAQKFTGADATFLPSAPATNTTIREYTGLGPGSYNNIVQNHDAALIYDINGAFSTGALVIAPHANATSGLRFDGSGNITSYSNLFLMRNVGIGTISPGAKLEVDGNVKLTSNSGASITFPDGTQQTTAWTGTVCGGDYAESVDVRGGRKSYNPGDVMVIDPGSPDGFAMSSKPYSRLVAGIYSTKPGLTGRRFNDKGKVKAEVPMAMVGIVPTQVSAENGPVSPGDLLVTSSTPGYAMKGTDEAKLSGAILGKALGSVKSGKGVIDVLVSLQ